MRAEPFVLALMLTASAATIASTGFDLPARPYQVDLRQLAFQPLPGAKAYTGVTEHGSGYRLEVPDDWNGDLVVYVVGGAQYPASRICDPVTKANCVLPGDAPPSAAMPLIREHLIRSHIAWVSPTFREFLITPKLRALDAIEVADAVRKIRPEKSGRDFIMGNSLGGLTVQHVLELFPRRFAGGLAGCTGDAAGFTDFFQFTLVAMGLVAADHPEIRAFLQNAKWPLDQSELIRLAPQTLAALGPDFPYERNAQGDAFVKIMRALSGGPRPMFDLGFYNEVKDTIPGYIVRMAGVDSGARSFIDNMAVDYRWETRPGEQRSPTEEALNAIVPRFACDPEVCSSAPLSSGQTRDLGGVYKLTGKIEVPLMELNALGDMIAFFSGAERYGREVATSGRSQFLVQRAIRDRRHCGFNEAEMNEAFDDLAKWVMTGQRPDGDDTGNPAAVAAPSYGCRFTRGQHDLDYDYPRVCGR